MNRYRIFTAVIFVVALTVAFVGFGCLGRAAEIGSMVQGGQIEVPKPVPPVVTGEVELYVDAVKGDDTRDGSSADKALKSLWAAQKLMDKVPADKRVILNLARGSVWREDTDLTTWKDYNAQVSYRGGRPLLTIKPFGKGDKPTISGLDPMPNKDFKRYDPEAHPNVWRLQIKPPVGHSATYQGVIIDGKRLLARVGLIKGEGVNILAENEADALKKVNETANTFYSREGQEGSWEYFVNSGSDPTQDKLTYEYKVRSTIFAARPWNRWEDVRLIGLNGRNGLQAPGTGCWMSLKGVEILYGATHNSLVIGYRLEDTLSVGYLGSTAFHAHNPNSGSPVGLGTLYDRCRAADSAIAFYDHAKNDRPWVYLRDCSTENVRQILAHGEKDSRKGFIVGHKHNFDFTADGIRPWGGGLGYLTGNENFIEDSLFRFVGKDSRMAGYWHHIGSGAEGDVMHARVRNSAFYATPMATNTPVISLTVYAGINKGTVDLEYDHCTMVFDFKGKALEPKWPAYDDNMGGIAAGIKGKLTIKNSVIAVLNAQGMMKQVGGQGLPMRLNNAGEEFELVFENCVMTYIDIKGKVTGEAGKDYIVVAPDEIFAGDVAKGDFTLKKDSPAEKKDLGYKPGRKPVYRPIADKLAAELPD